MSKAYVIEAAGTAAGLVVRQSQQAGGGFRFFASAPQFTALERQVFRRSEDAARAARALASHDASHDSRATPNRR